MSQLEEGPSVMQVGGPLRRKSDDPILAALMSTYSHVMTQAGIPEALPGQKSRPFPEHLDSDAIKTLLAVLDSLLDRYAFRCVDLIDMGLMELPRRNNNPFYIAKTWIKRVIFKTKPGVTERIWQEIERRDRQQDEEGEPS